VPDSFPLFDPGHGITCHVNADVIGGRYVELVPGVNAIDGNPQVRPCAAGGRPFGVAARDKVAGQKVLVHRPPLVSRVEAGAALAHGQDVQVGAGGVAIVLAAGIRTGSVLADTAIGVQAPIAP
jgi:hypothetical protein